MFKDYDKYLSTSLKVYLFVLVAIFIMKIVGLDYFGLDVNNPIMMKISGFIFNNHLENIWYALTLYFYTYCIVSVACNNKRIKMKCLFFTLIGIAIKVFENYYGNGWTTAFIDIFYLYFICIITNKQYNLKKILKRTTIIIVLTTIYQIISGLTRNCGVDAYKYNFIQFIILDLDYLLLCLITVKLYFYERSVKSCTTEVGSFSLKKINLKTLLKRLQKNLHNFKEKSKEEKIAIIIYLILSLIWNLATIILILVVAKLNNTLIECLFILTSFWLSKRAFGKAFHLSSMIQCFIVSNLTYYCLNRITTPLGISIIIPILLGVGLSYVTSKLVKKTYKPLYKGMPEDLFEETILKVTDKDSIKYKVCYDFYIAKESDVSLSFKYNYSIAGIRKIKDRINEKIKELK